MCRTGIWIPRCRNTEFNFWTCGFWSRARICGQAHVYPAWSKVQALLTQTCWQGARSVWFAVTGQEDDMLMMFLKCKRAQWGTSHFPRLAPRQHQSLSRLLPLGDIADQKFRESWHESGRARLGENPPTGPQQILMIIVLAQLLDKLKVLESSWEVCQRKRLCAVQHLCLFLFSSCFAKSWGLGEDQWHLQFLAKLPQMEPWWDA